MDPFSVTTDIVALAGTCLNTVKDLTDLRRRFGLTLSTLDRIIKGTTGISASLGQIQWALLISSSTIQNHLERSPGLSRMIDTAFIGCSTVILALKEELEQIDTAVPKAHLLRWGWQGTSGTVKPKIPWKENRMKSLLEQIDTLRSSIKLLLRALIIKSESELQILISGNISTLENLTTTTNALRESYPSIRTRSSIFDMDREDSVSVFWHTAPTAGNTEVGNNFVVDSKVYRRALMGDYLRPHQVMANDSDEEENDTSTITGVHAENSGGHDDDEGSFVILTLPEYRSDDKSTHSSNGSTNEVRPGYERTNFIRTHMPNGQIWSGGLMTDSFTSPLPVNEMWHSIFQENPEIILETAIERGLFDPKEPNLQVLLEKHEGLKGKYRIVKKCYFEKDAELQRLKEEKHNNHDSDDEVKSLRNEIGRMQMCIEKLESKNRNLRNELEQLKSS